MGDGKIHLKKVKNNDSVKENECKKFTQQLKHRKLVLYRDFSMQQWKLTDYGCIQMWSSIQARDWMQDLLMKKGWEINWISGWWGWWITLNVGIQGSCIYHTALPLTPWSRNDGQKDFHWVIFHETQTHTHHEGRNAFLMGYHRTTAKNSLSHQTTPAFSPHYGNSFYRSRPSKASVLACWTLSYMFACPHK